MLTYELYIPTTCNNAYYAESCDYCTNIADGSVGGVVEIHSARMRRTAHPHHRPFTARDLCTAGYISGLTSFPRWDNVLIGTPRGSRTLLASQDHFLDFHPRNAR